LKYEQSMYKSFILRLVGIYNRLTADKYLVVNYNKARIYYNERNKNKISDIIGKAQIKRNYYSITHHLFEYLKLILV